MNIDSATRDEKIINKFTAEVLTVVNKLTASIECTNINGKRVLVANLINWIPYRNATADLKIRYIESKLDKLEHIESKLNKLETLVLKYLEL
jgi:hypothetical protein